jgi:hypothetical protein
VICGASLRGRDHALPLARAPDELAHQLDLGGAVAGVVEREGRAVGDAFGERNVFCAVAVPGAGGDQTHRAKRMTPDAERDADVGAGVGAAQGFEVLGVAGGYVL